MRPISRPEQGYQQTDSTFQNYFSDIFIFLPEPQVQAFEGPLSPDSYGSQEIEKPLLSSPLFTAIDSVAASPRYGADRGHNAPLRVLESWLE